MALEGWVVTHAEKVEDNVHLLQLSHADGTNKRVYAAKYTLTKEDLVDHGKHYALKVTWLFHEVSHLFMLPRAEVYTDKQALYFSVPGDPDATEIRADEKFNLTTVVDAGQLALLRRSLILRWALGMTSRAAQLRWREYSPERRVLVSVSAYGAMGDPAQAYVARKLEDVIGDRGEFLCEQFNLKTPQAALLWRNKLYEEMREVAMQIDSELTFVANSAVNALYDSVRAHVGHVLAHKRW